LKLSIACVASLVVAVLAAASIGYAPTQARWGDDGVQSMKVIAGICLGTAILAFIPVILVASRWPEQIGSAALAGTGLRLLLTMGAMVAYQILADPQLPSFLFWAVVFYLLVLAIDTVFGVIAIQRFYRAGPQRNEGAAS